MTLSPYDQDEAVRRLAEIWADRHEHLVRECMLVTIKQAEQMLSIGRTKVLEIFPVVRLGEKSMRVRLSDIHNYINKQTRGPEDAMPQLTSMPSSTLALTSIQIRHASVAREEIGRPRTRLEI